MAKSTTEMKTIILILLFTVVIVISSNNIIDTVDFINQHEMKYAHIKHTPGYNFSVEKNIEHSSDKQKLTQTANAWKAYYKCTEKILEKLTASQRMPSTILTAYEGGTARLPCGLCVAPDEGTKLLWKYAESPNQTFRPLPDLGNIVHEDKDIVEYHVEPAHAGLYRCEIGRSVSGLIILHVIDEEYDVVKPSASHGPYPAPPVVTKDLTIFTSWSTWSECSSCGRVGRRRRYGMCYVKITPEVLNPNSSAHLPANHITEIEQATRDAFEDYPEGIPCRYLQLPKKIRDMAAVKQRRNEIMIAMCKVPCTNNTIVGNKPQPLPTRKMQFAVNGERVIIRCPGTTLRDMPVSWRVRAEPIIPRSLDENTRGRIHLNARDDLMFTDVQFSDSNIYSCWQGARLAGTVKLVVWGGEHTFWNHHTILLVMVVIASLVLRYLDRVLNNTQLQMGNS